MTRVTLELDLDPLVLDELERLAERDGKTVGRVASELLARAVSDPEPPSASFQWVTHDLGVPRFDLTDKDAVRAALDGPREDHDV